MYVHVTFISLKIYSIFIRMYLLFQLISQYNASHLVLLSDDDIVYEASSHLIKCIQDFEGATVIRYSIRRSPNSVINFLPGELK